MLNLYSDGTLAIYNSETIQTSKVNIQGPVSLQVSTTSV